MAVLSQRVLHTNLEHLINVLAIRFDVVRLLLATTARQTRLRNLVQYPQPSFKGWVEVYEATVPMIPDIVHRQR